MGRGASFRETHRNRPIGSQTRSEPGSRHVGQVRANQTLGSPIPHPQLSVSASQRSSVGLVSVQQESDGDGEPIEVIITRRDLVLDADRGADQCLRSSGAINRMCSGKCRCDEFLKPPWSVIEDRSEKGRIHVNNAGHFAGQRADVRPGPPVERGNQAF